MSKAERTRQYIIEKTAPIFNTKGYIGTSLHDLTIATGLTKGSIYGNFENKDEVALAAFDYNLQSVSKYIRLQMETKNAVIDKLLVYPETYRNHLNLPILSSGCPIANTTTEADDTHPLLKLKAANAYTSWKKRLEELLKLGIETDELKSDININEFTTVFISIIQGGILQSKATNSISPLNTSMTYLENCIKNLKK